jgi:hypothetical protein
LKKVKKNMMGNALVIFSDFISRLRWNEYRVKAFCRLCSDSRAELPDRLTQEELEWGNVQLARTIEQALDKPFVPKTKGVDMSKSAERMRRKILAMCYDRGFVKNGEADRGRLEGWCIHRSYLKKGFNAYTAKELPKLVWEFEQVPPVGENVTDLSSF